MNQQQRFSEIPYVNYRHVFKYPFVATLVGYLQKYDCETQHSLTTWNNIS